MPGLSERSREALLNYMFGKTSNFDTQPSIFVGLSSTTPNEVGGNVTEPSTGGYARQSTVAADWNSAATAAGTTTMDNANAIAFPQATADYLAGANITHFVVYDALAAGNYLGSGALGTAKPILQDDTPEFAAGDVNITLAPV